MSSSVNPKVTVKDYQQYYGCSERTAKRYRESDRRQLETISKTFKGTIRLKDLLKLYTEPPGQIGVN